MKTLSKHNHLPRNEGPSHTAPATRRQRPSNIFLFVVIKYLSPPEDESIPNIFHRSKKIFSDQWGCGMLAVVWCPACAGHGGWLVAGGWWLRLRDQSSGRPQAAAARISGMKAGCCCCPRSRAVFGPPSPWRSRLAGRGDGRPPPPAQPCHHGLSGTRNLCIVVESYVEF